MVVFFAVAILGCTVASLTRWDAAANPIRPLFVPERSAFLQVLRIACISPWAYIGFENISHSAEEFRFSHRKTFRLMAGAVVAALVLYAVVMLLSVSYWPPEYDGWLSYVRDLGGVQRVRSLPAVCAAERYLGAAGRAMLTAVQLALILTSLIGNMLALSRLLFAMAKDKVISARFAEVNRRGIPGRTVWLIALLSLPIPFLGRPHRQAPGREEHAGDPHAGPPGPRQRGLAETACAKSPEASTLQGF